MAARSVRLALIGALALASTPLAAQLGGVGSPSYRFLKAVRDAKGNDVTQMLKEPGSRLIDTTDQDTGETALHIVVRRGDARWAGFLLSEGANPNIRDRKGDTPLLAAVDGGWDGLIGVLTDAKANPNIANGSGETPLIRAVQRRDLGMVRDLIAAGADPDQADIIAGKSARAYAKEDPRAGPIAKLFAETPVKVKRSVSGPTL
ncbi:ankyrin repeat domain-containing protein [uncultured Sphingomonas sp.]|uniref:ankyrin repeat domain-containing protein n=1 Tax=uncultured Sphingomonas sp. TaxID=158754 RepID=UPI0035CBB1BA